VELVLLLRRREFQNQKGEMIMATWQEIYDAIPDGPFGSGKDEQALTDAFEDFVGGPSRAFQLMRIYTKSQASAGKNYFKANKKDHINLEQDFKERAGREDFTEEEAQAYLDYRRC
jgi:hypothetical protein